MHVLTGCIQKALITWCTTAYSISLRKHNISNCGEKVKVRINKYRSLIQALSLSLSFEQGRAIPYHRPMNIYVYWVNACVRMGVNERETKKQHAIICWISVNQSLRNKLVRTEFMGWLHINYSKLYIAWNFSFK